MKCAPFIFSGLASLLALLAPLSVNGREAETNLPGTWKNRTPAGVTMTADNRVFCQGVTVDPAHPGTLYLCVCAYDVPKAGLFKTTDGGATWAKIGKLDAPPYM